MNLYEIISTSGFDDAEAERIAELLNTNDFLKNILKKYGSKAWQKHWPLYLNSLMKSAEGSKKALHRREQSIEQDVGTLNSPPDKKYQTIIMFMPREIKSTKFKGKLYRDVYVECLLSYFCEDESLKKFLHEFQFPKSDGHATQTLLKGMVENCERFGFSKKKIKEMYEYLYFDRITSDEEATLLAEKAEDQLKEKILELSKQNSNANEMLKVLQEKLNSLEESHEKVDQAKKNAGNVESQKLIEKLNERLEKLSEEINQIKNGLGVTSEIKKDLKRVEGNLQKEVKDLDDTLTQTKTKILKEIGLKDDSLKKELSLKYDEAINDIHKRLVSAIEENKRGFLRINEEVSIISSSEKKTQNINREEIFIHTWVNYLSTNHEINLSLEEATIYHCVFKSQSYVLCTSLNLLRSWVECLGLEPVTRVDTVSPLWVNKLDWYGLMTHLDFISTDLKIGILLSFDVGLTESYLQPSLESWFLSEKRSHQKIFLVPSKSADSLPQRTIHTLVSTLPYGEVGEYSLAVDISNFDSFNLDKFKPAVKYTQLRGWTVEPRGEGFRRTLVDIPREKDKIDIPENTYANFLHLYSNLRCYFHKRDSLAIAFKVTVNPYLKHNLSSEKSASLSSFILEMLQNE